MRDAWNVWFTTYGTYAEPDVPQRLVFTGLSFERARTMVERHGFGYCMKPSQEN